MDNETDVLEFNFPDYEELYPPFPDVKVALFDKEDSYSRNRNIADQLYADRQKEEEQRREDTRRAELKKMERLNPAALRPKSRTAKVVPIIAAAFAAIAMVATSLTSGGMPKPARDEAAVEETFGAFKAEDGKVFCNTRSLCYNISVSEKSADKLTFYIDVRNTVENNYTIKSGNFYISDGTERIYCQNPTAMTYDVCGYGSANVVVQFEKDSNFDCTYIGYYEENPVYIYYSGEYPFVSVNRQIPESFDVSIEQLL